MTLWGQRKEWKNGGRDRHILQAGDKIWSKTRGNQGMTSSMKIKILFINGESLCPIN